MLKKIARIVAIVRGCYGFSIGLYLYSYGALIYEGLLACNGNQEQTLISFLFLSLTPLQWSAFALSFLFVCEIILEVPTGLLADIFGRKFSVISCFIIRSFYFLTFIMVYISSQNNDPQALIFWALLGFFIFAISFTMMSGSFLAWAYDTLEENGESHHFNSIISNGQFIYQCACFIGALIGIFMWLEGYIIQLYSFGAFLCLAIAFYLSFVMHENTSYEFMSTKNFFKGSFTTVFKNSATLWLRGAKTILNSSSLMLIFFAAACFLTLSHLIAYIWPAFTKANFQNILGVGFSFNWGVLVIIVLLCDIIGSYFTKWYVQKQKSNTAKSMAFFTSYLNLSFAAPVIAIALLFSMIKSSSQHGFLLFVALLCIHRFFKGAAWAPQDTLQNLVIASKTQERSTILSLGALFKNMLISILFFFGLGHTINNPVWWLLPSGLLVISSFVLIYFFKKQKQ